MLCMIMIRAIMLSVVILSVIMLSVIILSAIMLSVVILSVIMLSVVILSAIMLSVVILSFIVLSVAAPKSYLDKTQIVIFRPTKFAFVKKTPLQLTFCLCLCPFLLVSPSSFFHASVFVYLSVSQ